MVPLNSRLGALLLLTLFLPHSSSRVTMHQQQSCYYQPYLKQLKCQCSNSHAASTYLHLRMEYFIRNAGQEVRSVVVDSCPDLLIGLDLAEMNPTAVPFTFKNSGLITLDFIRFDPAFADRQRLKLSFENVDTATLSGLHVDEALEMVVENVKQFRLLKSTFSHIPADNITVSRTKKLEIRDSNFLRIYPRSIVVDKTKTVEVVNNEFSINAIKVILARDGSHLFISCNRLLGLPVSPECVTTTTTTTTTTPSTPHRLSPDSSTHSSHKASSREQKAVSVELVAGLISGVTVVFLVLLLIIFFLCFRDRQEAKPEPEGETETVERIEPEAPAPFIPRPPTPPPMPNLELETLLGREPDVGVETRPKFSAPVWLEEIHNNKIFNKRRNLIMEEEAEPNLSLDSDPPRENSKTESDQDSHTSV